MGINKGYLQCNKTKESDEVYTPECGIRPLLKYLKLKEKEFEKVGLKITIWCPFDEDDSLYVKILRENGYNVINSHINTGQDFFTFEPKEPYDCIVSNPPFSIKDDVLKRLWELNKPYAMLFPLPTLQGQNRFKYLKDSQVLIFNKRINFYKDKSMKEVQKGVCFTSIYICKNFLPYDLIFEELE
jgi:hypothetical protein